MNTTIASQKKRIRENLRCQRRALSSNQQERHALACCNYAQPLLKQTHARHVALYIANDGELDPGKLIKSCWDDGYRVYLPLIDQNQPRQLLFARYLPEARLKPNQFGIPEPDPETTTIVTVNELDVIFMPLVAYTEAGERLGMGGGYYDNTLRQQNNHRAELIGLAHSIQKQPTLPVEPWDIRLDGIVTEKGFNRCK
ncbi:MAG TPA: 5-formyltetrahydrofolate cyclo-ligase [Aeromonadales bacterium]|nr:5-formyltetrahydrofolate cyclo-ligase [Aeromonadales bacterium]